MTDEGLAGSAGFERLRESSADMNAFDGNLPTRMTARPHPALRATFSREGRRGSHATEWRSDCRASRWRRRSARREDIDEHIGFALRQPVQHHPLVQIDAVFHDQVLMARDGTLPGRRAARRRRRNCRPRRRRPFVRQPPRAFEADAGSAVIEGGGVRLPATAVTGANEAASPGVIASSVELLSLKAGLQIGELDLLADVEHAALQSLHVEQHAAGEERRRILDPEPLQAIGRPHFAEAGCRYRTAYWSVANGAAMAAEMAKSVHMGADLADFGGDEFVVPDRAAARRHRGRRSVRRACAAQRRGRAPAACRAS